MLRVVGPLLVVAGLLLAACGEPGAGGGTAGTRPSAGPDPEEPVACGETVSGDVSSYTPCPDDGARGGPQVVEPTPGQADVHPIEWDRAKVDGRVVRVVFWSGVEPCHVLDHVEVTETRRRVTITLYEGHAPDAGDVACIEIAVRKATEVTLEEPVGDREVVDGAEK